MSESLSKEELNIIQKLNDEKMAKHFFTPDNIYIDLGLFKDIPLGVILADSYSKGEEEFQRVQDHISSVIIEYQNRRFDTLGDMMKPIGYDDQVIEKLMEDKSRHTEFFVFAPTSKFIELLIRHTLLNQNHSGPAEKFVKKKISREKYRKESIPINHVINIYPLHVSSLALRGLGELIGDTLGVNVRFINKDPNLFDESDWKDWWGNIDCFYLDSLGRCTAGETWMKRQVNFDLAGKYVFSRKRFEGWAAAHNLTEAEFEYDIQQLFVHSQTFDLEWIQNNDLRLVDEPSIPIDENVEENTDG